MANVPARSWHSGECALRLRVSYDDQFNPSLLPEDRNVIGAMSAIQQRGKPTIVYRPSEAEVIILVTSRLSEDLMAVYDGRQEPIGNFLLRVMGRDGLE